MGHIVRNDFASVEEEDDELLTQYWNVVQIISSAKYTVIRNKYTNEATKQGAKKSQNQYTTESNMKEREKEEKSTRQEQESTYGKEIYGVNTNKAMESD